MKYEWNMEEAYRIFFILLKLPIIPNFVGNILKEKQATRLHATSDVMASSVIVVMPGHQIFITGMSLCRYLSDCLYCFIGSSCESSLPGFFDCLV